MPEQTSNVLFLALEAYAVAYSWGCGVLRTTAPKEAVTRKSSHERNVEEPYVLVFGVRGAAEAPLGSR